jgi:hypothetical protein
MTNVRILQGVLAALLASNAYAAPPASASPGGYYVVVPMSPLRAVTAAQGINVSLSSATLPAGLVGLPYDGFNFVTLLTVTGDAGYTGYGVKWTLLSGSLPAGLTLGADGRLTGTPTTNGTSSFQLRATYKTKNGDQAYQVVVGKITVDLAAGTPPQAIVGQAYAYDIKPLLKVSGDSSYTGAGVTWTVVSSSLPAGLYLRNDGAIAGTPTAGGTGTLTARASYRNAAGEQTYEVVSLAITVSLAAATPPQARVGVAYNYDIKQHLTVSGDSAYNGSGVTWGVVTNSLPAGLALTTAGTIAGTPSATGTGSVTARATYRNVSGEQAYSITSLAAYTFAWGSGSWSTPAACGTTTSTRSVWCQRSDGATVADSNCTGTKPATTQSTTDYSACSYSWQTGAWNTPAACGSTTSTRSVWCQRSDGATVADSSCGGAKPITSQGTTNYSSCTYSYSYGGWGSCSVSCGGGTQYRSATCYRSDGAVVGNSYCGAAAPTAQSCNTQACASSKWTNTGYMCQHGDKFAVDTTAGTTCSTPGATVWVDSGVDGCSPYDASATDWNQYTCK